MKFMFAVGKHTFAVDEHMFTVEEHKFADYVQKIYRMLDKYEKGGAM